jgi:flavin reductase (DIM6/NTAB) family NADH-FMN oxidoreductase RutF
MLRQKITRARRHGDAMNQDEILRAIFERFPYGIFVVATNSGDDVYGILATWVMQVSFEPPLIAISVEKGGVFSEALKRSGLFSLSLVRSQDIRVAKGVLKAGPVIEGSEVRDDFVFSAEGVPALKESAGILTCRITHMHDSGDHLLIVAEATSGEPADLAEMMTLRETGWKYRRKPPAKATD